MNRLGTETSPYLLQHAGDPVDWQPWDEQALAQAREQDKPIMLSVGYSACHWCHVMAHESFQDAATAELLNKWFVSIKVDREERPDLDKIYQTAQMLITQRSGGWPLTMFLLPDDQTPFFGGTYFPDEQRHGLPGFKDVLQRVHDYYLENKTELQTQKHDIQAALGSIFGAQASSALDAERAAGQAFASLEHIFDPRHGGFGNEPKFPNGHFVEFLFKQAQLSESDRARALHMSLFTLEQICRGGIYDQIEGGFCRYSVDERWAIPHFEKMLYDNASLLNLCGQAAVISGDRMFADSARETAAWVMAQMQAPDGGYYAALDADSEGEEGKYYVWTKEQARELWGDDYAICAARFGLDTPANFEGRYNLFQHETIAELTQRFSESEENIRAAIERGRNAMRDERSRRVAPGRDEKVLCAWNALMVKGMAHAARLLDEPEYLHSAQRAIDFMRAQLWDGSHLAGSYKDGQTKAHAFLDDYAFLIDALLETVQSEWNQDYFLWAVQLADIVLERFEDKEHGGFFFTPHEHESLIQRPRALADEATPSGYGVVASALIVLGNVLGRSDYLEAAERALAQAAGEVSKSPANYTNIIGAALSMHHHPEIVIIRGEATRCAEWVRECAQYIAPLRTCFAIPTDAELTIEGLADKKVQGEICAYPCQGMTCQAPLTDIEALRAHLKSGALQL